MGIWNLQVVLDIRNKKGDLHYRDYDTKSRNCVNLENKQELSRKFNITAVVHCSAADNWYYEAAF